MFYLFLSESLAEALDANITFPLSLLISICSWATLPHLDASTKLEVATLIWLSIAWLGRNQPNSFNFSNKHNTKLLDENQLHELKLGVYGCGRVGVCVCVGRFRTFLFLKIIQYIYSMARAFRRTSELYYRQVKWNKESTFHKSSFYPLVILPLSALHQKQLCLNP